jgi:hypothetical protein
VLLVSWGLKVLSQRVREPLAQRVEVRSVEAGVLEMVAPFLH